MVLVRYYKNRKGQIMEEIQITTTIILKKDGEILTEVRQAADAPDNESEAVLDTHTYQPPSEELTEDEAERYAVASDLANVCDYLDESEVIKIRLIISKAQERKEREYHGA